MSQKTKRAYLTSFVTKNYEKNSGSKGLKKMKIFTFTALNPLPSGSKGLKHLDKQKICSISKYQC